MGVTPPGIRGMGQRRAAGERRRRTCKRCGEEFYDRQRNGIGQQFCSAKCFGEANHERVIATYPPREEVARLYIDEGISDRELGRRFGRSYTWALNVRKHYGIAGRPKGQQSKPVRERAKRPAWGVKLKGETICRNCGGRASHLHHIVPRSVSRRGRADLANGLPLCVGCHRGWHSRTVTLYHTLFTDEEFAAALKYATGAYWIEKNYPDRPEVALLRADEIRCGTKYETRPESFDERLERLAS